MKASPLLSVLLALFTFQTASSQVMDTRVLNFGYDAANNEITFKIQLQRGAGYIAGSSVAGDWSDAELAYDVKVQPGVTLGAPLTIQVDDIAVPNGRLLNGEPAIQGVSLGQAPNTNYVFKITFTRSNANLGATNDLPATFADYMLVRIPVTSGTPTGATTIFQRVCFSNACGGSFWNNSALPPLQPLTFRPTTTNIAAGTALAIDLLTFTATATQERIAKLDWATASEKASSHFLVERSADGLRFTDQVARMQAAGISSEELNYHTFDYNPLTGANYYRLKMVNKDGTYKYSETRRLVFDAPVADVTAIPNPFQSATAIRVNADRAQMANFYLMDAAGRIIRTGVWEVAKGMQEFPMPLSDAAAGNYILTVQGSTILAELKLVKTN